MVKTPASSGPESTSSSKILVADDDESVLRMIRIVLKRRGYSVTCASDGVSAVKLLQKEQFDVIISDISMPEMNGIQLLRKVREVDLDVPVILVTGMPSLETAIRAIELGVFHYLKKPFDTGEFTAIVARAVNLHKMARLKREALSLAGSGTHLGSDRAGLESTFNRMLANLKVAYQPIVNAEDGSVYGYEALMRVSQPEASPPFAVIEAGERLERLQDLGRLIRRRAAKPFFEREVPGVLFVNLHPEDLLDPDLLSPDAILTKMASRVVFEVTERSSLEKITDVRRKVLKLRNLGFRIAVDDLGAGYSGLTSFATLEPEYVKIDMTLVRDVDRDHLKQNLIRSITHLCKDMGMLVVAEGVETGAELHTLVSLGCDLLQGFLIARPGDAFPEVSWPS